LFDERAFNISVSTSASLKTECFMPSTVSPAQVEPNRARTEPQATSGFAHAMA
jgi:hypothetical protein